MGDQFPGNRPLFGHWAIKTSENYTIGESIPEGEIEKSEMPEQLADLRFRGFRGTWSRGADY